MSQRKIFNVLNRNLALRPQHQQRNEIPNPKVVQHQESNWLPEDQKFFRAGE